VKFPGVNERLQIIVKGGASTMKKVITNFFMDILLSVVLMSQVFTGILLHRFPPEMADVTVFGLSRYTWGTIHWSVSILFALVIITHLILHWGWVKAATLRYMRMRPRALLASMIVFFLFVFLTPYYVTRDFPDRENIKNYTQTSYQEVVIEDGGLNTTGSLK
jgi:amino acid transporter